MYPKLILTVVPLALLPLSGRAAVSLLQPETFDSPTSWTSGNVNPTPPRILPDSGPDGFNDPALQISSSVGSGPGSRLIAYNRSADWTGDYSGLGVSSLRMDLRNTGSGDLFVRVAVNGPGGWFVSDGHAVNAGLGYASFLFDVSPAGLSPGKNRTSPLGDDLEATLASVTELRILHSVADQSVIGEVANARLRVDNVTAIPEPDLPLLIAPLMVFFGLRKR